MQGRIYRATDVGVNGSLYFDTGAAWLTDTTYTSGVIASRPAEGTAGRFYFATDVQSTGALSFDTGTAWIALDPLPAASRRLIHQVSGLATTLTTSLDNYFTPAGTLAGSGINSGSGAIATYLDPAKYAVPGKTAKLILEATVVNGTTPPGVTFVFRLFNFTMGAGTSTAVGPNLISVVTGSTLSIGPPGANAESESETAAFAFPAAGHYLISVNLNTTVTGSAAALNAFLYVVNV